MPYSIHVTGSPPHPPEATKETRALLQILLVEAATNTLKALRAVTLSPDFTCRLH